MKAESVKINDTWKMELKQEFEKPYFDELSGFVKDEYLKHKVYPPPREIFKAFEMCSFDEVKVVIIGQDPYHGHRQANGLCFAVNEDVDLPPSLRNIFKEIKDDLNVEPCENGDLTRWAKQGVLLLNATLTVRASSPGSHQKKGWEEFTDAVIRTLSEKREGLVFILWGNYAKQKGTVINRSKHFIIESPHPSPFSAYNGFFGSKPFSKTNKYLKENGLGEINWV
ncbi:MAG: uracil-DNA glycosylase [Candidatus Paceibacterota bacterium]|jgi:uracil-DNA glycosylase